MFTSATLGFARVVRRARRIRARRRSTAPAATALSRWSSSATACARRPSPPAAKAAIRRRRTSTTRRSATPPATCGDVYFYRVTAQGSHRARVSSRLLTTHILARKDQSMRISTGSHPPHSCRVLCAIAVVAPPVNAQEPLPADDAGPHRQRRARRAGAHGRAQRVDRRGARRRDRVRQCLRIGATRSAPGRRPRPCATASDRSASSSRPPRSSCWPSAASCRSTTR